MESNQTPQGDDGTRNADWRERKIEMLAKHPERRQFSTDQFELREAPGGILRFSGYASVTDTPYDVGFFTETIKRGAFKRTLSENPDVQMLINHGEGGSGMPIARTGRNMTLSEDDRGLRVDAELDADDPDVQLLARKMKSGLLDSMSFAFRATDDEWSEDRSARTIKSVTIHRGDVSVVNQPASPATSASIRSGEFLEALAEVRAGAQISSKSMEVLSHVLALSAKADDAVDETQAVLSRYLGVPNPNDDDASGQEDATGSGTSPDGEQVPAQAATTTDGRADSVLKARRAADRQAQMVRRYS